MIDIWSDHRGFFDDGIDHELTIVGYTKQSLSSKVAPLDAPACDPSKGL
jgi:hypothetical protein